MDEVIIYQKQKNIKTLYLIFSVSGLCLGDGRGGQTCGQELSPVRCQVSLSDLQITA